MNASALFFPNPLAELFSGQGPNELLSFFAVLVRYTVLFALFPILGDNTVPAPLKVMLGLIFTVISYPVLVTTGMVKPIDAAVWGATTEGIIRVVCLETLFGLCLGFVSKIIFDLIIMTGDLIAAWMGFSSASQYDPFYSGQTQVISKILYAFGILLFLTMDGHHWLFQASVASYQWIPIGGVKVQGPFIGLLLEHSSQMIRLALQLSAPMALSFFGVNLVYGIVSRAMPQLNILVLSFSVSAMVGIFILMIGLPEYHSTLKGVFGEFGETLFTMLRALRGA